MMLMNRAWCIDKGSQLMRKSRLFLLIQLVFFDQESSIKNIETVPFGRFTMSDLKDNLAVIVR